MTFDPDICEECQAMLDHEGEIEMHRINTTIPLDGRARRHIVLTPLDISIHTLDDELPDGGTVASVNAGPIWVLVKDSKFDYRASRQREHAEHHGYDVTVTATHNMTEQLTIPEENPS